MDVPGLYARGDGIALPQTALRPGLPEEAGFSPTLPASLDSLLHAAIDARVFPGAAYAVGRGDVLAASGGVGRLTYDSTSAAVTAQTPFDLASLTKAIGTTVAVMTLWENGQLDLDAPVARYVPAFAQNGKAGVTVADLLAHRSGLASGHPFHTDPAILRARRRSPDAARRAVLDRIYAEPLESATGTAESGRATRYSDLGFIVLGEVVAAVAREPLDAYLARTLYIPLGMAATGFRRVGAQDTTAAPTEIDPSFRERLLQGEVHDETASLLGGVAGHAGLFSTADDLARLAAMLANGGKLYGHTLLQPETVRALHHAHVRSRRVPARARLDDDAPRHRRLLLGRDADGAARLWPHRLYRHLALARPRLRRVGGAADQPHLPHARPDRDRPRPRRPRRPRRGQPRGRRRVSVALHHTRTAPAEPSGRPPWYSGDLHPRPPMPTYVYRRADGTTFEHFQRMSDDALTEDPETGEPVERTVGGGAGLIFKGTGFYLTDYARKKTSGSEEKSAASEKSDSGDKGDAKAAKPDKGDKADTAGKKTSSTPASSSKDN